MLYKFVVVNNEVVIPEKNSYRRGLKIVAYFNECLGIENITFLDWGQMESDFKDFDSIN